MARGILVVQTAALDGREDDFHDWYDNVHIPEILKVPGFISARRYARVGGEDGLPYLAIYEVEADDLQDVLAATATAREAGEFTTSDAIKPDTSSSALYRSLDEPKG
jgi:hypothetical protein